MSFGAVVAAQPFAQAVVAGEKYPFFFVYLVDLVSVFPLHACLYSDAEIVRRPLGKPCVFKAPGVRHNGEDGKLIYDTVVERRRFKSHHKLLLFTR